MSDGVYGSTATTVLVSSAVIFTVVLIGLVTFGVSNELGKARQMYGLSAYDDFDPDSMPAPAAGDPLRRHAESVTGCDGILFKATENGTRFVRESGGGLYYAAEVNSRFSIYTQSYGHLVRVEKSSLDSHTYRKLKHALYHCDGMATRSGLYVARKHLAVPQV